jgi:large subunit ribosomal protein L19
MDSLIKSVEESLLGEKKVFPKFQKGDIINVHLKVKDGNKERIQQFEGTVIQRKSSGKNGETFTVRRVSGGVGIERILPINLPSIDKIEVKRYGKVRRARIFYLRNKYGRAAKIKEAVMPSVRQKNLGN